MLDERCTIILPAFNGQKWIKAAVFSALNQNFDEPYRVIVRDDGSTDCTVEVLESIDDPRLTIIKGEKTPSIVHSFQAAFDLAKTPFVTIVGQDDTLEPEYLTQVMAEFDKSAETSMVSCKPKFIDGEGNPYTDKTDRRLSIAFPENAERAAMKEQLRLGNRHFGLNTYRRRAVIDAGGFDPAVGWLLDWDLYLRLLDQGDIKILERELCSLGIRPDCASALKHEQLPAQHQYYNKVRAKNFKPPAMKLIIATPFYMSQEYSHYGESLVHTCRMLTQAGIPWDLLRLNGDSYVDRAKNTLVANFLDSDGTDLLMIDSDMQWHPNAVSRLLQHPEEIVGGAYPFKNNWGQFAGNPLVEEKEGKRQYAGHRELFDGSCLLEAYNLAGGFLRIKRAVLERFQEAYPDDIYMDDFAYPGRPGRLYTAFFECARHHYQRYGEDAEFSRKMRAIGERLWIDPNIGFIHYGIKGWEGNFHQSILKPPEEIKQILEERAAIASVHAAMAGNGAAVS